MPPPDEAWVPRIPDLPLLPFLSAWPTAAFLLDREGRVRAHASGAGGLLGWLPDPAIGLDFFSAVLTDGQVSELGGAFLAAMDDENLPLAVDLDWQLAAGGETRDVSVRLRRVGVAGEVWGLAIVEDLTRARTAERALGAAFGESRGDGMTDPATGLFTRRQFDFVLPIELRRATRYGHSTAVLAIDLGTLPSGARQPRAGDGLALRVADRSLDDAELRGIADYLQAVARQTDVLFHFEPSRFHIVLTHTDSQGAALAAQRLGSGLQAVVLPHADRRLALRMAVAAFGPELRVGDYAKFGAELLIELEEKLAGQG